MRVSNILICALFVFLKYPFYDIFGRNENILWIFYNWGITDFFIIVIILMEVLKKNKTKSKYFKNPYFLWRCYCFPLIIIVIYSFLRVCYKYSLTKDNFEFFAEIKKPVAIQDSIIIWLSLIIPIFIWIKWIKKRRYN